MRLFSTCRACGQIMEVTDIDVSVHLGMGCDPQPTRLEALCAQFLAAVRAGDDAKVDALQAHIDGAVRPSLTGAALYYSQQLGWPVFPLRAGTKEPATRNGFKDATTDRRQIESWWKANPQYNIGLPTGHAFDVIDIDPVHGGRQSLEQLDRSGALPDVHGRVVTAGNRRQARPAGIHLYILPTGERNGANLLPGVDYRAEGGFVVGAPSTLGDHQSWQWLLPPSPAITSRTRQ